MLYRVYDKAEYASITSFTFLPSLIAPAIAPFLGGILLDYFGWHSIFLLSGPICLILALFSIITLKDDNYRKIIAFDWLGLFLTASLLINIFFTLSLISKGESFIIIFIGLITFLILLICFILWGKKCVYPLVDLTFF